MAVLESNIYALWAAKQTAKGSVIAGVSATKAMIQLAGDFSVNRDDASEPWSDLERFGSQTDFVNTVIGEGNPAVAAQPDQLAYMLWLYFGQETVTGAADPWTHSLKPGPNGGFWSTWWVRVGANVIRREKYGDCRIGGMTIEGSTGSKVVRATPNIISLQPGITYQTTDPAPVIDKAEASEPYRFTEGRGTYTMNGVVLSGTSQFTLTMDDALGPYYGDDVTALDLVPGNPTIGIAATILADSAGVQEYNKRIYGSASPAAATAPLKDLEALGTYTFTLTRRNAAGNITPARDLVLTVPGVRWSPDVALPASPSGGPVELAMAGAMRKVTGQDAVTIAIRNGVAAYTV